MYSSALVVVAGYVFITYCAVSLIYRIFCGLWNLKLGSALGFSCRFKPQSNSWCVITGASDGIGLAYAHEFARRGYNLLLISRNISKLQDCKQKIDSKSNEQGKEILLHAADFTRTDIYDDIKKAIDKLDRVDVLINNVGMSYEHPEYFTAPEVAIRNEQLINVNATSCTRMLNIVLPIMETQKSGVILNISSFSAVNPSPLLSVYAATKAYVDILSRSLAYEYAKKGITIQSVLPGFVATNMSKIRRPNIMSPTPEAYVRSQLKTVGLDSQTTGYWSHELQYYITQNIFPLIMRNMTSNIAFNQLKLLRCKALKKIQSEKSRQD